MVFEVSGQTIFISVSVLYALYQAICWIMDRYNIGGKRKQYKLMQQANKNMMRQLLRNAHKQFVAQGCIDEDELEHIEQVYQTYHQLGGNGTANRWISQLRDLKRANYNKQ